MITIYTLERSRKYVIISNIIHNNVILIKTKFFNTYISYILYYTYIYIVEGFSSFKMDKRTMYAKLRKLLMAHGNEVMDKTELERLIMVHIGSRTDTIRNNFRIMLGTGLIEEIEGSRFLILPQ